MKISKHIVEEAKQLLEQGAALPTQITSAPHFYVAESTDQNIHAFSSIKHDGKDYKIGVPKAP